VNADKSLRLPLFLAYFGVCVWLALFWKWESLLSFRSFTLLPILIVVYTAICVVTNWPVRSRWMILFPYYSLLQVLLMPAPGAVWCFRHMVTHRTIGRYKFGVRRGRYVRPDHLRPVPEPA